MNHSDDRRVAWILAAAACALFAAVFWMRITYNVASDLRVHIDYARELESLSDIRSPHFLFQLSARALELLGMSIDLGAALILGACYGGMAGSIFYEVRRAAPTLDSWTVSALCLGILVSCHIFVFTAFVPNLYSNYLTPTVYHNPTQQLNKLFALLTWFMYLRCFCGAQQRNILSLALLAVCCVLSAVAKPSFLIAFLPLTGIVACYRALNGDWHHVRDYAVSVAGASSAVLLWQFTMTYGATSGGGIHFEPFALLSGPQYLLTLPLSLAFPIVTVAALWKRSRNNIGLRLAWAYMAIGLSFALFLVEDGPQREAGNFFWTAQTGAFILYVQSLLVTAKAHADGLPQARWPLAMFGVHLFCGIIFIIANCFFPDSQWR